LKKELSSNRVTKFQIRAARIANLFTFLEGSHASLVKRSGHCLYLKEKDSVYIKEGIPGYMDFASGSHGNSIDFLMQYLNYRFVDAVLALTDTEKGFPDRSFLLHSKDVREFIPPPRASEPFHRLHAYLQGRGIPANLIDRMEKQGILYQEAQYGNAVFINPQKDYCEIRGTYGGSQNHFHSCRKTSADRFWYIFEEEHTKPHRAFICESAIDAISLLLLYKRTKNSVPSVYVSIGGVYNQRAIDRIKRRIPSVIAVDHDKAGELCRHRNKELPFLIPVHKDWNEDLQCGNSNTEGH
jgi:hypothetical protein